MTADELVAGLASPADFENAGVERFFFLQDLHFTPVIRNGRGYIKVVSTQPVHEPYLNFLLAVERPNGRLLREYTVLLDPPGYSASQGAVADTGMATVAPPQSFASRAAPAASSPIPAGDGRYTTVRNDTLWSIATRLGDSGVSHEQLMDSLLALNPSAFVHGDPRRLKVGQTLVLPRGRQLAGVDETAPASLPAAESLPGNTAPPVPGTMADADSGAPTAAPAGDGKLAKVEADLLLANTQRDLLSQRMDDMQQRLESLQKALEHRDHQVRSLRAELERHQDAGVPASAPPAKASERTAPAARSASEAVAPGFSYWPWVGVGVLAALLAALLLARRGREEAPQAVAADSDPLDSLPPAKPLAAAVLAPVPIPHPHPVVVATQEAGVARLPAASADSLEGADIYIAYGRFNQARDMLRKAVAVEPNRRELRMKLLLVLAELGDAPGFHEEERGLLAIGGDQRQVEQLKSRYPAMLAHPEDTPQPPGGDTLGDWDDLELGDLTESAPADTVQAVADEQPDFAMDLDDLSLELDWDKLDDPFESPKPGGHAAAGVEAAPDFRGNLHELPEFTELDLDEHDEMFGRDGKAQAMEEDFSFDDLPEDFGSEQDELLASLDYARACIDQGNLEEAYRILKQVIESGDSRAKAEARELLARIA